MKRLVLLLFFLVSIGLFVVIVDPVYKENKVLLEERGKLDEALAKARELEQAYKDLEERASSISVEDYERLQRFLPDRVDNVRLILDIDQIARRYGLTITGLSFQKKEEQPRPSPQAAQRSAFAQPVVEENGVIATKDVQLQSLRFQFTVSSSYVQFLSFLRDLEKSLRLVDIVGIQFEAPEEDFYDFKVEIATYWLG